MSHHVALVVTSVVWLLAHISSGDKDKPLSAKEHGLDHLHAGAGIGWT
jgi:hypothetical protein